MPDIFAAPCTCCDECCPNPCMASDSGECRDECFCDDDEDFVDSGGGDFGQHGDGLMPPRRTVNPDGSGDLE